MTTARGHLRIYLGAAPGVGKTYAMLSEGQRRCERGTDVVVGFVETHGRSHTAQLIEGLETVPRKAGAVPRRHFTEMDLAAVLARKPEVALVDELAHTNVPDSGPNTKRWQDIDDLLDAGIDVISTVNIQHLESINDVVQKITGVPQRETVPDVIVRRADQIELIDMSPEALRRRMAHGNIYSADKVDAALSNYFRPGNLAALRELALLWLADRVDAGLQDYRQQHDIVGTWEARERVVVGLTGGPEGDTLIRRAARIAARSSGDLLAVHVSQSHGLTGADPRRLSQQRQLTEDLGGSYHQIIGDNVPDALLSFARAENATQLVLGGSRRSLLASTFSGLGIGATTIRDSGDIDVHIVTHSQDRQGSAPPPPGRVERPPPGAGFRARGRPAAPDHRGAAGRPGRLQLHQRRPRVLTDRHRRRARRRPLAGRRGRHRRLHPAELLLHPAHPHLHHRRNQQRAVARRLRPGGHPGEFGRRPGAPDGPGKPPTPPPKQKPWPPWPAPFCAAKPACRRCSSGYANPSA